MNKAIRVVVTRTYTYVPQLDDFEYKENGIETVEAALLFDQNEYLKGGISIEELCGDRYQPKSVSDWRIIDE